MQNNNYVVIMAGGIGSRFWPSSTEATPKQFLDILGIGMSLLQMTYERSLKITTNENIIVITHIDYKKQVAEQLPELPFNNILCEPTRNNTAPSIAYAALHLQARDANATFVVLSADHVILKEDHFATLINMALDKAKNHPYLITLGIKPNRPDTGYGYIELGENYADIIKVASFKEKPNLETASEYLRAGNYLWNAGIFIWSVETILNALDKYSEGVLEVLTQELHQFNSPTEQDYINEVYPNTKNISIDYAVMEHSQNIFTIPADIGWSDLGTWKSLYEHDDKDENENVINHDKTVTEECTNILVKGQAGKAILVRGLKNYIIVDEKDALLIYPIEAEQDIKQAVKKF